MVKTRSEQFLETRGSLPPLITPKMVKGVSDYRRETLETEARQGLFREPGIDAQRGYDGTNEKTSLGVGAVGLSKRAQFLDTGLSEFGTTQGAMGPAGNSYRGPSNSARQLPEVYSPLWLNSNLNLPRDRATINAWCRAHFTLNPMVKNAISLHSTYPISKLNIHCKDRRVEQFMGDMADELDLLNVCCQIAQEFWCLGEAFPYAQFDDSTGKWSRIIVQNPDYVHVVRGVIAGEPIMSLRPDENLKRIVMSNKPADIQQKRQLDPSIIEHVKRNENIPLNNFYVTHLAQKISPYETRGSGLVVSCFKALMLFDMLRENKYVQASSLINPLTLVKIGNENFKPTPLDIETYREIFESAEADKNFKIFTHDAVTVERVGANAGIIDISGDITQLIKEIYIGLMVPSVLMDGGADTSYANGGIALDVLKSRYLQFRNMLSTWLRRKIFAPISKVNDFYELVDNKKRLIVPEIDWNHMSLFDTMDYVQVLSTLSTPGEGGSKRISSSILYKSLGTDWDTEQRIIRKEQIDEVILAKEKEALGQLSLNELRALNSEDEIKESVQSSVPGENKEGGEENKESPLPGEMPTSLGPPSPPGGSAPTETPPPPPPPPPPPAPKG